MLRLCSGDPCRRKRGEESPIKEPLSAGDLSRIFLKLSDCRRGGGNYLVYIEFKRPLDKVYHTKLLSKLGSVSKAICCIDK